MTHEQEIAEIAIRIGEEFSKDAAEAFESMCVARGQPPATDRERVLIRVLSLQLASAIARVLASP